MTPSADLIAFLKGWEGKNGRAVTRAYLDSAGVPTIGYGHTLGVRLSDSCTEADADDWLRDDIGPAAFTVDTAVHVPLTQCVFDALVSFEFNTGKLPGSTLLNLVNAADFDRAALQFTRWDHARVNGVETELPGLRARRVAEQRIFTDGDYSLRP